MNRRHCASLASSLLCGSVLAMPARALDAPKVRAVWSVSGNIGVKNPGEVARVDTKMLEALPRHSFNTSSPWFNKPVAFTGPLFLAYPVGSGAGLRTAILCEQSTWQPKALDIQ